MDKGIKKKVLFIMQLPPPVHGVSVMSELIKKSQLINDEFDCEYINLATASEISDLQKISAVKYLKTLKIILSVLLKLIKGHYYKIYITVFPFGFSFFKDALVVFICKLFGYKPILHLHTYGFKKSSERSRLRKKFYKAVFKKTEVICLSDLLVEDIEDLYQGEVFIVPNGIPQVNFENTYAVAEKTIRLLFLANLVRGKGILVLLDALSLLKETGKNFELRIAGSENDITYEMLKKIIKEKELTKEVSLLGAKFGEEKYNEFRNADIFILPSNYDTFGLVLLEAMQFGVPCISTNVGGIPDVLGEGRGLILKDINPVELSKTIVYLMDHPLKRKEISVRAFNYFQTHFTGKEFEKGIIAILNSQPLKVNKRLMKSRV